MADSDGHVLRATLPRPKWILPRWSRVLFLFALLQPVLVGVWAFTTYAGSGEVELAAYEAVNRDLAQANRRFHEAERTLEADQRRMQSEVGGKVPVEVEQVRGDVVDKWGEGPYPVRVVELAAWCMSGETDPTVVKCEREGEWITGMESAFILHDRYGALRPVQGSRLESIAELLRMRQRDLVAATQTRDELRSESRRVTRQLDVRDSEFRSWMGALSAWAVLAMIISLTSVSFAFLGRTAIDVEIRQNGLRFDGEWIAGSDIVGCIVEGDRLIIKLLGGDRRVFGPFAVSPDGLADVAESIARIGLSSDERIVEAQARMRILRRQKELESRLPQQG